MVALLEQAFDWPTGNLERCMISHMHSYETTSNGNTMIQWRRMDFGLLWAQILSVAHPGSETLARLFTTLQVTLVTSL